MSRRNKQQEKDDIPSRPVLHRTISSAEKDGILKALDAVKQKSSEIENMGMSARSFSLGLLNVVVSSFILGRWPEHFWVWTSAIVGPMLIWTFLDKKRNGKELFMLDFCWVANILLTIFSLFCFAQIFAGKNAFSAITSSPFITAAVFAASCGPLAWSVLVLGNALVLHDPTATMSLFIHIIPPILMWSLRWHAHVVHATYPNVFRGGEGGVSTNIASAAWDDDFDESMTCTELNLFGVSNPNPVVAFLLPAMVGYFLWWIPYTIWLLMSGLHHSVEKTGKLTVFRDNVARNSAMSTVLVGKKVASEQDLQSQYVALKYMIIHSILCILAFLWSYLCHRFYSVHTIFCMVLVISAVREGGAKYYKMTTKWYLKAVEKMLEKD